MSVYVLKALREVTTPDSFWEQQGWTLTDFHALISPIELNNSVPEGVRQHFENARNAWLYSYFAYQLLSVAVLTAHTAVEAALKAKAGIEGVPSDQPLYRLMDEALQRRWIVDQGFSVTADRLRHWEEHREILRLMDAPDCGPYVEPKDDQAYARQLVTAIREIRNSLAHGENLLTPAIGSIFRAIAEFINQLFPEKISQASVQPATQL